MRWGREGVAYAAEEMPDEDYEDFVFVFVDAGELVCFAICVEDWQVGDALEICFRGRLVGDLDVAVEIASRASRHGGVFAYGHCRKGEKKGE